MATAIHSGETGNPDTGTWVQASGSSPSYVKVVMADDNQAEVTVLSSETNGVGAGSQAIEEIEVQHTRSVILPPGTYYINADIENNDTTVDVTVQN